MGSSTGYPLGTKTSVIGEPGEGFEELARFWLVVETTFLPLDKLRLLKPKVNHLLPRPLSPRLGKESSQNGRLLDAILLNTSFELVFVFELP